MELGATCAFWDFPTSSIEIYLLAPVLWHLGLEMPAIIFVALLLGFKVLLVISFTVTYICKWWHL